MITIRFYAWIREKFGIRELRIDKKPQTLCDLLQLLRGEIGEKADILFDGDGIKGGIMIGINNRLVRLDRLEDIYLRDGDIIDIMPLGSGG